MTVGAHPSTDVLDTVSSEIPFGLLPQENTIFGAVIEAYDALRSPAVGASIFVRGEVTLPVQHCLIARKGVKFEQIERIISHEQVKATHKYTEILSNYSPRHLDSAPASSRSTSPM